MGSVKSYGIRRLTLYNSSGRGQTPAACKLHRNFTVVKALSKYKRFKHYPQLNCLTLAPVDRVGLSNIWG